MESFSELYKVCIQVFEAVVRGTSVFVLPIFLGRIVFANLHGEGFKAFSAFKGILTYFVLISGFPLFLEVLFSIPESFLPNFNSMQSVASSSPGWEFSAIPFGLDRILEVILSALYWVAYYLHVFFMLLMCSMAPIIFLVSSLLGVGMGLEIFMGLLIIGSSWPIIWYGFDQVHSSLVSAQSDEFGAKCLEVMITLFKGLAPVTFAGLAIKSPAGRAIAGTAQTAISSGQWAGAKIFRIQSLTRDFSHQRGFMKTMKQSFSGRSDSSGSRRSHSNSENSTDRLKKAAYQHSENRLKNEDTRPRNP